MGVDDGVRPAASVEIEHAGLRDRGANHDPWIRTGRLGRERRARRRPQRELASGRVPDGDDPPEIERRLELGEHVDSGGNVQEGRRPTA